jgi:tetratricopeptide (TPR) repeat protein
LVLVWSLGASLGVAHAASDASARLEVIRQQMEKGQGLFVAGKFGEAAEVFEAGFQQHPYSAFLFNAAVCHEKQGELERALGALRKYLEVDPKAPDSDEVAARIARLQEALRAREAAAADPSEEPAPPPPAEPEQTMKSLVVIETTPAQAPVLIYRQIDDKAPPFVAGQANRGYKLVAEREAPVSLTLDVGRYHIVVEKFREFNRSEADIVVSPGHVHHFQANLSQGAFMAFLRVSANVPGAYVFIDDAKQERAPWGRTPHGELIAPGKHELRVEAPGYQPHIESLELEASDQRNLDVQLIRLDYGIVRIDANVPEAHVRVDERSLGIWRQGQPALEAELPAGIHELSVTADGHKTLKTRFEVPRGQVLPLRAHMIPTYPRGTAWTQAAIAAVFLGTGTYLGIESNRLHGELSADRGAGYLDPTDERVTRGRWFAIGANAGFAIGGVFAILSTYNFLKDPYPDSALQKGKRREFEDRRVRPAAFVGPSWQSIASGVDPERRGTW